jgi:hypothetical protein
MARHGKAWQGMARHGTADDTFPMTPPL